MERQSPSLMEFSYQGDVHMFITVKKILKQYKQYDSIFDIHVNI